MRSYLSQVYVLIERVDVLILAIQVLLESQVVRRNATK